MNTTELLQPVLTRGIRNVNFFTGRLLSAQDLQAEQQAHRSHHQQLGRALGAGVVSGLWVAATGSGTSAVLKVSAGLAVNRHGHALELPAETEVVLATSASTVTDEAGLFGDCQPGNPESTLEGKGIYILCLGPASDYEDRVPMHGLTDEGRTSQCGARYTVEGVKFRLVPLDATNASLIPAGLGASIQALVELSDSASLSKLRNLLTHACLGTNELAAFPLNPFELTDRQSRYVAYGALDALRTAQAMGDCEVPLAALVWNSTGISILDNWAVRRPPAQPLGIDPWPLHVGFRRRIEAQAAFLQFQEQLGWIRARESGLPALEASQRFRFLPPAGYLSIGTSLFNADVFFQKFNVFKRSLDPAFLRARVEESWSIDPIDLAAATLPPLVLYSVTGAPDYLLFMREEVAPPPPTTTPPTGTPPPVTSPPTVSTGQFEIKISVKLRNSLDPVYQLFDPESELTVTIEDSLQSYPTTLRISGLPGRGQRVLGDFITGDRWPVFVSGSLPYDSYTIHIRGSAYREVRVIRALAASRVLVEIELIRDDGSGTGGGIGGGIGGVTVFDPSGLWDKLYTIPKFKGWPWPPEPGPLDPLWDPVPDTIYPELLGIWDDFSLLNPDAPGDPGDIQVYLQRGHRPDTITDTPYAYVVFGQGGAYMPVILTAQSFSFGVDVGLSRGGIAGLDREVQSRLESLNVTNLAALTGAWRGLVGQALSIDNESAGGLISDSRTQVTTLLNDQSFTVFSGLDATADAALKAGGITTRVGLANATPDQLVTIVGRGMTVNLARRIIAEARNSVPRSAWSLADSNAGFRASDLEALEKENIHTLGEFQSKTADAQGLAAMATILGVPEATVTTLTDAVDAKLTESSIAVAHQHKASAPVGTVAGLDVQVSDQLFKAGVGTVKALAVGEAAALAPFFGGNAANAQAAVDAARRFIGLA